MRQLLGVANGRDQTNARLSRNLKCDTYMTRQDTIKEKIG